jgi:hypothetical protein
LLTNKDILLNLEKMEKRLTEHDENRVAIFNYISKLVNSPQPPRRKIGFRRRDEDENVNDSSDHFD